MAKNKIKAKGLMQAIPASFIRGAITSGIVAAVQDKREGADLLKSALLGGAALSTAVSVENLLFNNGLKLGKKNKGLGLGLGLGLGKGKGWKKNGGGNLHMALMDEMMQRNRNGLLASLPPGQRLLVGLLIGAGLAYLLGDEKLRGKLMRAGMQLYSGLAGGFEEVKEQMADIQAEMQAAQMSAP